MPSQHNDRTTAISTLAELAAIRTKVDASTTQPYGEKVLLVPTNTIELVAHPLATAQSRRLLPNGGIDITQYLTDVDLTAKLWMGVALNATHEWVAASAAGQFCQGLLQYIDAATAGARAVVRIHGPAFGTLSAAGKAGDVFSVTSTGLLNPAPTATAVAGGGTTVVAPYIMGFLLEDIAQSATGLVFVHQMGVKPTTPA
jgi:hypothetical protein